MHQRYGVGTQPPALTPTIGGALGGFYTSTQTVTLTGQPGEAIYYTTDGSTPTTSSTVYTGPITVSSTETIKAIGTQSGYTTSAVGSATYTIETTANFSQSNLVAWYRADQCSPVSGSISSWPDLSGKNNTLSDATVTWQPVQSTNVLNGQSVLHFSHSPGTYMTAPDNSTLDPNTITYFMVMRTTGTGTGRILDKSSGSSGYSLRFSSITAPTTYINASTASGSLASNTWGLLETKYDGNTISFYVNGTLTTTALSGDADLYNISVEPRVYYQRGTPPDADVAEVLIFNTALSDTVRHNVEAYLHQRYGVGTQPPTVTPTFSVTPALYSSAQTVTLTGQPGETIYYTTDGSTPTTSSTVYTGPITTAGSIETINAIGTQSGYVTSSIGSATYTTSFNRAI